MLTPPQKRGSALLALVFLTVHELAAHGPPRSPGEDGSVWLAWTFPLLVTTNLILAGTLYTLGLRRIWQKAGPGKVISKRQAGAFAAGMAFLVLALVSPIDALSDELQSVHMIQHMLLMNVAAPLLVLGMPGMAVLWTLPLRARRRFGRWRAQRRPGRALHYLMWQPVLLLVLYAFVLWIWHLPRLYEAALHDEIFHDFQHLTFLVASCLFWRVLLDPVSRMRLSRVATILYLFLTSLHATILGVFMALAPSVWYPTYEGRTLAWNLSALEDQQLAGLIMWMPACMVYALIVALVVAFWLRDEPPPVASVDRKELVR
jgi:putative membrane protein